MIVIILSTLNIFFSIFCLLKIKNLEGLQKKIINNETPTSQEQDIHNLLNHRLLDIQNRKYSLQRKL